MQCDPSQQQLLIPNPLSAPCSASYPHHLVTIFTELAEIDSVVDDIRKKTGRDRISLAGWSRSMFRSGLRDAAPGQGRTTCDRWTRLSTGCTI